MSNPPQIWPSGFNPGPWRDFHDPAATTTPLAARNAANEGMRLATAHADEDIPGWSRLALDYLYDYALCHDRFAGWMVTSMAEIMGAVPVPATKKGWGSLFVKAQKLGWIRKDGYTQDPNRHCNPVPIYVSLIFRE